MSLSMDEKDVEKGTELHLDKAFDGAVTHFPPSVQQIVIGGVVYTQDDLKKKVLSLVEPWKEARRAHSALRHFSQAKPRLEEDVTLFLKQLKATLVSHYGFDSEILSIFGFKPEKKRRDLTVEENILRAAKARLTREKRGTKGKKQRRAIVTTETPNVSVSPDGKMTIGGNSNGASGTTQ